MPFVRAAAVVADPLSSDTQINLPTYTPVAVPREQLESIIKRYLENKRQIEAVSKVLQRRPSICMAAHPGYKYDLQYHDVIYGILTNDYLVKKKP